MPSGRTHSTHRVRRSSGFHGLQNNRKVKPRYNIRPNLEPKNEKTAPSISEGEEAKHAEVHTDIGVNTPFFHANVGGSYSKESKTHIGKKDRKKKSNGTG